MKQYTIVDEYINDQPADKQKVLQQFRQIIKKAAPDTEEIISYGMPAFKQNGSVLVYFAAGKEHYGFYPTPEPIKVFKDKLTAYKTSKGAIQFPANKPLPEKLIAEIVKYRIKESFAKSQLKKTSKKSTKIYLAFNGTDVN